jgi:predicted NBD/HSP70 family sugar kinase
MRGIDNAYYVGGGTGVAEALKLGGRLVETDSFERYFPRAWRLRPPGETITYDDALSARGINAQYARIAGLDPAQTALLRPELNLDRDPRARELFELTGRRLADLVSARITALMSFVVRGELADRGQLQRVVVGQQLGRLFADERTRPWFQRAFRERLNEQLRWREADEAHLVVRASTLRAAPAIGAAASALIAWDRAHG